MSLSRRDWALLAITSAEGAPLSPVQLQKSLFLLGQELPEDVAGSFYSFEPYNYGPFDSRVYTDAERLCREGFVAISRPPGQRYDEYLATPAGLRRAEELRKRAPAKAVRFLGDAVNWSRSLGFAELVRAIYAKYPAFRVNSVFTG